jgi:DNA topoisomerase I
MFYGGGVKWNTLVHNGVMFPPEYEQQNVPIMYDGIKIHLSKNAEEIAFFYAKYINTDYVNNNTFNKNYWNDWKKHLHNTNIHELHKCDFTLMYDHIQKTKITQNKNAVNEDKYKFAIVNGKKEQVGSYKIEPPSIFIGRGKNPNLGRIKRRIYPEDIIINISKNAPIPKIQSHLKNHTWGSIIHDNNVEWLASWKDNITNKTKYVFLNSSSNIKGIDNKNKFELAKKLGRSINSIIKHNNNNICHTDIKTKQIATATYFIYKFSIRIGNEKGDDEADTVGVTSLRIEHIKLLGNNKISLNFLGKDSVKYSNTINVNECVYNNLTDFVKNKNSNDLLFDQILSKDVNEYLQTLMDGLTSKVFRTYNASYTFETELYSRDLNNLSNVDILNELTTANIKVAVLMNHQKNISKGYNDQLIKIQTKIKKYEDILNKEKQTKSNKKKIDKLKKRIKEYNAKKTIQKQLKNISLGTSKLNYIDPRIIVAFAKKYNIPMDKVFTKTIQNKFKWAMDVDSSYRFG